MRAVVYIRCASSDPMDALDAIERQMGTSTAYAGQNGLEIIDVVTGLSRLSRYWLGWSTIKKELGEKGVNSMMTSRRHAA